ncbi:hypothetical protein NMY22_g6514 [Coprinellus aureogranulatus]|nr:hypothetical protein NMY22_g6514 [Coprinellus aureogranulatus]
MKQAIAKENWEQKGKFPPALKPQLAQLALLAIRLDEYDDHFFNLMPVLFPYNKFTMTKLIKRTVYADHIALLQARQDELLKQLKEIAEANYDNAEREYQKALLQWSARQERNQNQNQQNQASTTAANASAEASADGSNAPTRHPTEERDKDAMDTSEGGPPPPSQAQNPEGTATTGTKKADHPPTRRYRLTDQMRGIIWDLVLLSNEACRLENEKNTYEGSMIVVSEQGGRKVLYQKIVSAFPEGWMSSGQISRDVSAMKKRFEKEAMEDA